MCLVATDVGITVEPSDDAWISKELLRCDGRHAPGTHHIDHIDDLSDGVSGCGRQREHVRMFHIGFGRHVFCAIIQCFCLATRTFGFEHILRFIHDDYCASFHKIDFFGFSCKLPERHGPSSDQFLGYYLPTNTCTPLFECHFTFIRELKSVVASIRTVVPKFFRWQRHAGKYQRNVVGVKT